MEDPCRQAHHRQPWPQVHGCRAAPISPGWSPRSRLSPRPSWPSLLYLRAMGAQPTTVCFDVKAGMNRNQYSVRTQLPHIVQHGQSPGFESWCQQWFGEAARFFIHKIIPAKGCNQDVASSFHCNPIPSQRTLPNCPATHPQHLTRPPGCSSAHVKSGPAVMPTAVSPGPRSTGGRVAAICQDRSFLSPRPSWL